MKKSINPPDSSPYSPCDSSPASSNDNNSFSNAKKLPLDFYLQSDVVKIAQELLGKILISQIDGVLTGGKIVETEAYAGITDKASHAHGGRRTPRTRTLYLQGGVAYVYFCYGMHHLFNVVTNQKDIPHAVLIRAIEPLFGISTMQKRRNKPKLDYTLTSGPGSLTQALGITKMQNELSLLGDLLWIEEEKEEEKVKEKIFTKNKILASPRIGVGYAKEDALLPWRFRVKNSPWTSPSESNYS